MRTLARRLLPVPEAQFREHLAEYRAAVEAHRSTEGTPAPWPLFEVFRDLVGDEDFVVIEDEPSTLVPLGPNAAVDAQIASIEHAHMAPRFSRETALASMVKDHLRDYYDLKPKDATKPQVVRAVEDLSNPQHPAFSAGFVKLKALDDQIKALRAQRLA